VYFAPDPMIYRARFRSFALMTAGRTRSRNGSLSLPCRHVDNQPRRRRIHHNIRRFLPGSNLQRAEIIYIHIFPVICTINANISTAPNAVRITLELTGNSCRMMLRALDSMIVTDERDSLALFSAIISPTKRANEQSGILVAIFARIFGRRGNRTNIP